MTDIATQYAAVTDRIARAAHAAGRRPEDITLIAAAKGQPIDRVDEYRRMASPIHIGHNYVQELLAHRRTWEDAGLAADAHNAIHWHFIGRLQRNKVKKIVGVVDLIHSVDSRALAAEIGKRARGAKLVQEVLIEVNLGNEFSKAGVDAYDLPQLFEDILTMRNIRPVGLMTMPPPSDDPDDARPYFEDLAELARDMEGKYGAERLYLSMGMSADFEIAIACGATHVRIGTALLGERPAREAADAADVLEEEYRP